MNEELEYYIDSIIKLSNKACTIKHKEDFNTSNYLQNEYKKCYAKIYSIKYKIMNLINN